MSDDDQPKIIIDSDWKNEAQAEKEKLSEAEKAAAANPEAGALGQRGELPPVDFRALVGTLATQAIMYIGGIADQQSGKVVVDLEMSRHFIDLLGVLEEKTKGNLTDEESKELTGVLGELRMRFVEVSRLVSEQMMQQGAAGGIPGADVPPPPQV